MISIRKLVISQRPLIIYGLISVFVTIIDITVSYIGEFYVDKLISNALGVIVGFLIQYFLASRKVFNSQNWRTFIIFLLTFLFGLACAQGIVWFSRDIIFNQSDTKIAFAVSKGLSIIIPFFLLYYIRRKLIKREGA